MRYAKSTSPLNLRGIATVVACAFFVTSVSAPLEAASLSSVDGVSTGISQFSVPYHLGTVDKLHLTPSAPFVIHVQTAHGNYQAQKKIAALLRELSVQHGIDLLLVEGAGVKLDPELDRHFSNPEWNRQILDYRAKKGLASAASLFLLETIQDPALPPVNAYGIESIDLYRSNRETFQEMVSGRVQIEAFLDLLGSRVDRLSSKLFSKSLLEFLKTESAYEAKQVPIGAWLSLLRLSARNELKIDLRHASHQKEWPSLVRLFKLQEIETKLDHDAASKEAAEFVSDIEPFLSQALLDAISSFLNVDPSGVILSPSAKRRAKDLRSEILRPDSAEQRGLRMTVFWKFYFY
jgi:hypothetical protein